MCSVIYTLSVSVSAIFHTSIGGFPKLWQKAVCWDCCPTSTLKLLWLWHNTILDKNPRLQALWAALTRRLDFLARIERDLRLSLPKTFGWRKAARQNWGGTKKHKYTYIHTLRQHASNMQPETCHRFVLWLPHLHWRACKHMACRVRPIFIFLGSRT